MTEPKIQTFKRGGSRFYVHPDKQFGSVPGVTSVVDQVPKPWLGFWNAKFVAEVAVEQLPSWIGLVLNGDKAGAIDYLKRSPFRNTSKAADDGTDAHDIFHDLAAGKPVGRLHPDMEQFARGFRQFMEEFEPEFLHLEQTIWSETYGYAGSFDSIALIRGEKLRQDEDAIAILDNKTTRSGVHPEVALQLNAYARGDYILHKDGTKEPLPPINAAGVVHIRPEGWKLVPVRLGDDVFELFLSFIPGMRWEKEIKPTVLADPIIEVIYE